MGRLEKWFAESPRRSTAEYACALARDRFWRDSHLRLIGAHRDWPDATYLLQLGDEIAHALVLVLSRLPAPRRLAFATAFFDQHTPVGRRSGLPGDQRLQLAMAAQVALLVLDLAASPALREETVVDLLHGAAQADDLTTTPEPAVDRLRSAVRTVRFDPAREDESDPPAVAARAVAEVLDPSSDGVAVKEILARAAFATVECRSQAETLSFLLEAERILCATRP